MRFISELDRALVVEASRHTHAIWSSGRELAEHTAYTLRQLDEAGPALMRYAGLVDETGLVASMKRYTVALASPDGGAIPAVGIGAVFTRADARGRGLAARLLTEILREARELGAGAAWLHSEIDPAYYERLGFLRLPGWAFRARVSELPSHGALSMRAAEPGDLDRMIAWYDASFPRAPPWLRPARSPAVWRYFAFRNDVRAWILSDAGADVGYLAITPGAAGAPLCVHEWSAPGIERERIWATLRAFAEREAASEVTGWLRLDLAGPPFVEVPRAHRAVPMVALLDPPPRGSSWTAANLAPERSHFGSLDYF